VSPWINKKKENPSKKGKYVKVCPKCGSTDVHLDFSNPAVWGYGAPTSYQCESCGHVAHIFPEILKEDVEAYKDNFQKDVEQGKIKFKKEPIIEAETGFFAGRMEIAILFFAGGIITSLAGLYLVGLVSLVIGAMFLYYTSRGKKKE